MFDSNNDVYSLSKIYSGGAPKLKMPNLSNPDGPSPVFLPNNKPLEDTHTFKDIMSTYFDEVNTLQHDADAQIQKLVAGETEDLHQVMTAMDEAETSFSMMMEIRNKLVNAYQEIMRMQL